MFRTLDDQKRVDAARKASLEEVIAELTGSKHYQRKMQALERELERQEGTSNQDDGEEPNDGNLGPNGEWDDHIPDDDLKLMGKVKGGSPKNAGHQKGGGPAHIPPVLPRTTRCLIWLRRGRRRLRTWRYP
jgi:hypothetical protein